MRGAEALTRIILVTIGVSAVSTSLVGPLAAWQVTPVRPDTAQAGADTTGVDSTRVALDTLTQPIDTALAASLGLPTAPSRSFPGADSILRELIGREGYRATRYAADTVIFFAPTREIYLSGSGLVEREGTTLEADSVQFLQETCALVAEGDPRLFESGTVMVGNAMSYDTCEHRGLVREALTNFEQSGVTWYLRGGLGIDSAATRLYAGQGEITSCDLPEPHYHFESGRVKWVSNNIMVARPAKLYIRDVPVMWFPFIFQDMRPGRRSGFLTPRFGINDLVRPSAGYRRHITNLGYYVAINDYLDVQASVDWFARTSVTVNGDLRYRWLDRFLNGRLSVSRIFESGEDGQRGRRSMRLAWNHQQSFNQRTRLNAAVDFATSSAVVQQNAVDPLLQTATLQSSLNFSKQADWGTLNLGGRARQDLSNDEVQVTLPDFRLTPVPITIGESVTWSPSFALSTNRSLNQRSGTIELPPVDGVPSEPDTLFADIRTTSISIGTPLRVGRWNWQNSFAIRDVLNKRRRAVNLPDPDDSTQTVSRVYGETFSTEIDWNTGINLPILFPSTWKLQPSVGIQNATGGPFLLRNEFTNGKFVQQGKRLSFGVSLAPTVFGFLPGIGPIARIRHSFSPQISWRYAPAADVPEAYLRALNPTATNLNRRSIPIHSIRLNGISNTFEGKYKAAPGDSADPANARKIKLLSVQTTGLEFDFEQAKRPGRTGWKTQTLSNSFTSDLLRGFSLRTTHDLWRGPVGIDTTKFDPFLRSLSARFSLTGATIGRLFRALTGGEALEVPEEEEPDSLDADFGTGLATGTSMRRGSTFPGVESLSRGPRRGRGFNVSIQYDIQRQRGDAREANPRGRPANNRTLGYRVAFSPTTNWSLQWSSQYNFTTKEFGQHTVRFDRELHRWRATFSFVRAPNGNFAFSFFINLLDQPEMKFNYDQRTVNR